MRNGANDRGGEPPTPNKQTQGWRIVFTFTRATHLLVFIPALILSICGGVLGPVMAIFLGKFFDAFADFAAGKISPESLMHRTLTSVHALLGVGAGTLLLKGGLFAAWLCFGEMQAKGVRDELFQALLQKDLEWFEMRETGVGTLLARLQSQIRELQLGTSQPMGFALQQLVEGFVALGLSLYYGWKLTLVILASLPISALILHLISRGLQSNIVRQSEALSEASHIANNAITHISLLKYFNAQNQESLRYVRSVRKAAEFYLKQARTNALQMAFTKFASTTMFVQGFWFGSVLVHHGATTAGKVITIFWSTLMAVQAFQGILPHLLVLAKAQAAAQALRTIIETVNLGTKFTRRIGQLSPEFCDGDIEVRDVSFAYPARSDHLVLHPSTFFFPAGETTFIIGRSGSGKSTVGSLLVRFYSPNTGYILVDGTQLEDLSTNWLRNNITLVQQHSVLFNETIFRNIAFGHQYHERVTRSQVTGGLELAALQATISRLPEGIDTKVGAGGSALSGGQKQRIAIARARLRNTPILVLDESTSALDYISRTSVMAAIRKWREHKTTIIITHDMTQIKSSDFVYVLEDGRVVAEGFRYNIEKDLKDRLLDASAPAEARPRSRLADIRRNRRSQQLPSEHADEIENSVNPRPNRHARRDSLEDKLHNIATGQGLRPDASIRRIQRISQYMGNRLAVGAGAVPDMPPPVPHVPATSKVFLDASKLMPPGSEGIGFNQHTTEIRVRPMSMHQSFVMQAAPRRRQTKAPPFPLIMDEPKVLRQLSLRRTSGFVDLEQTLPQQLPVRKILSIVWPLLSTTGRLQLTLGFIAVCIQALVPPIFAFILVKLFETFYLQSGYKHKALIYSMGMLAIASADGIASFFMKYLLESAAQQWVDTLRIEALMRILEQPRAWFDDTANSPAYLTSALDRNAEEMRNLIGRFAAMIFAVIIMMAVSTIWAFIKCWKLTLVAFSTTPVVYGLTKSFNIVSSRWESRTNVAGDDIGAIFVETFSDIRTVRTLTLESYFHRKYHLATSSAFSVGLQRAAYSGFLFGLSVSTINFIMALIFYYGAHLAKSREFSVNDILNAFSLLTFSTAAANGVVSYMPQLASSVDTGSRLIQLSRLSLKSHEFMGNLRPDPAAPTSLMGPIHFINLSFYYPTRPDHPALNQLNLTIPPGLCTAIVGSSGSGKSTIASLLLKLYLPSVSCVARTASDGTNGPVSLTLSGRDIRSLDTTALRSMIAIVPQTPVLFPGTVRENICYGLDLNSALTASSNVRRATEQAGVHEFILSLPLQYETVIGEGGLGVSGGQAQRIVIARALVRRPKILILDEPTSALDGESARIVKESIKALVGRSKAKLADGRDKHTRKDGTPSGHMTVIVITHAKEMMQFADTVAVLENGQLVEEGTYEGLLAARGTLWEMLQAGGVAG